MSFCTTLVGVLTVLLCVTGVFLLGPPVGKVAPDVPLTDLSVQRTVKKIDRVREKASAEYGGDHRRVVDLVRASAIFETPAALSG